MRVTSNDHPMWPISRQREQRQTGDRAQSIGFHHAGHGGDHIADDEPDQHAEQSQPALAPDVERDHDRERKQRDRRVTGRDRTIVLLQEPQGGDADRGADQKDDEARGFRRDERSQPVP